MLLKILCLALVGGFTVFIVGQNLISIRLSLFGRECSIPLFIVIAWFLAMGFFAGLFWRNVPHYHRGKNRVPLIRADMKVCR